MRQNLHLFDKTAKCINCLVIFLILICCSATGFGQGSFSSGSTGADGAFAPTGNQTVQLPESGVFNFTTVNIPSGVTIKFAPNSKNTAVMILASGNVTIAGTINLNGEDANYARGGKGGPGGFSGGDGGLAVDSLTGYSGEGPGGGGGGSNSGGSAGYGGGGGHAVAGTREPSGVQALNGLGGSRYGTTTLLPLMGGSGGGGGSSHSGSRGTGGGGGGGAILIASSGTITLSGYIYTNGGNVSGAYGGGGGAGGAVRLVASTLSGTGVIQAEGKNKGGYGYIRAEAFTRSAFNPTVYNYVPISLALPNPVSLPANLQLKIASIGGVAPPAQPTGLLQAAPDVVLPATITNPIEVVLEAANVPLGSTVQIKLTPARGARTTVQSTPLAGTLSASTATASVTLPMDMSVITAVLTMDLTAGNQPLFFDGERVKRIEVTADYGGKAETVYVTESGKRLTLSK